MFCEKGLWLTQTITLPTSQDGTLYDLLQVETKHPNSPLGLYGLADAIQWLVEVRALTCTWDKCLLYFCKLHWLCKHKQMSVG